VIVELNGSEAVEQYCFCLVTRSVGDVVALFVSYSMF